MPSTILLFGAGKSAGSLIRYLIGEAEKNNWKILIADADKELILSKTNNAACAQAFQINVKDDEQRSSLIQQADIVISLMPPALHILIAKDCIAFGKNLLTASYIDEQIKMLEPEIKTKGLLFLCEMGLDPGIDHMSAMQIIDTIRTNNGTITSFKSHCGGLVAPESDDNPWHYKISWNPRNVVLAGKAGAVYKTNGKVVREEYGELFDSSRRITVNELDFLAWYPNRDSLAYIDLYNLHEVGTFIRTTLRHYEFMSGWKKIIELGLTNEEQQFETEQISLADLFAKHLNKEKLKDASELMLKQLNFIGIDDHETLIPKGKYSAADSLQFALEKKLILNPGDKDMVVMVHEISYKMNNKLYDLQSSMAIKGENEINTAMAKTVGLPLGIAAKLILNKEIVLKGLHIPIHKEIYEPVLEELKNFGVRFYEKIFTV